MNIVNYGDIRKIDGHRLEPVNCVIGGSPCQNLSSAGNRKGLEGDESCLYYEQIRVIKELREQDVKNGRVGRDVRPRYMVWENVVGSLSCSGGRDFAAVLEKAIQIIEPKAPPIQVPEKGWPTAGGYRDMGGRWSLAWRVLDAQYWGTPQRRRRIALVVDFGGDTAGEILFEPESVSGNSGESKEAWKRIAGIAENCARGASKSEVGLNSGGLESLIRAHTPCAIQTAGFCTEPSAKSRSVGYEEERSPTLRAGVIPAVAVYDMSHSNDVIRECGETVPTLAARMGTGGYQVPLVWSENKKMDEAKVYSIGAYNSEGMISDNPKAGIHESDVSRTLDSSGNNPAAYQGGNIVIEPIAVGNGQTNQIYGDKVGALNCMHDQQAILDSHKSVRRLTPLECERLQGFPDNWTDIGAWTDSKGKLHKDSSDTSRYKALGNSIAIPQWAWVLTRLCDHLEEHATMGSLFDGIGGFPLIWERINGELSCRWSSEIEEFPIAVTKFHFKE